MGKCKDCKHYERQETGGYGYCNAINPGSSYKIGSDYKACMMTTFWRHSSPIEFATAPDFGCVLHEKNPE